MEQQPTQPAVQPIADQSGKAIASLIFGILGIFSLVVPFIGMPSIGISIVLGIQARKSRKRGMAIAGIVLSSITLLSFLVIGLFFWGILPD